jgi:hypothetical protein
VPSISWYDDRSDTQLLDFIPMLKMMATVEDVRPFIVGSVTDHVLDIPKCTEMMTVYLQQQNDVELM